MKIIFNAIYTLSTDTFVTQSRRPRPHVLCVTGGSIVFIGVENIIFCKTQTKSMHTCIGVFKHKQLNASDFNEGLFYIGNIALSYLSSLEMRL